MNRYLKGLIFLLFFPTIVMADVYKWVDDNGVAHYSDTQRTGASEVKLPKTQSYHSLSTGPAPQNSSQENKSEVSSSFSSLSPSSSGSSQISQAHQYSQISLLRPDQNTTIWDGAGNVVVEVTLMPTLMEGDRILVLLDGKPQGDPQASTMVTLTNIDRGQHTVQVQVVGADGKEIGSTQTVTFYLHRATIQQQT